MKSKCNNCTVYVDSQHKKCPLCSNDLHNDGKSSTAYPPYPKLYYQMKDFTVQKLLLFITITIIITAITTNILTLLYINTNIWSVIVVASLLYCWVTVKNTFLSRIDIGSKILYQFISLSILFFVIDICTDFYRWSTNYVIPFLSISVTLITTIIALTKRSLWNDYMGYLLLTFFISLFPIFLFVFNLSNMIWASVIAIVYSLLTIIGMMIFADRKFKDELKKRFHFK